MYLVDLYSLFHVNLISAVFVFVLGRIALHKGAKITKYLVMSVLGIPSVKHFGEVG